MDSQLFSMMSRVINSTMNYFTHFLYLKLISPFLIQLRLITKKCGILLELYLWLVYFNRFEWVKCQILKLNQISSWNLEIGKYPWNCKMSIKLSFPLVCSIKCDDVTNKERCGLIMCIELWCIITRGNLTWLILDVIWRLACNLRITMTYIPLLCQLKITYITLIC
jgi:hypothetical protein